jgi:SAM-dependent methyltransferase
MMGEPFHEAGEDGEEPAAARRARTIARLVEEQHRLWAILEEHRGSRGLCCLHCGAGPLQVDGEFRDAGSLHRVLHCAACGLSQLERRLTEREVAALEDENPTYNVEDEDIEAKIREHSFILDLLARFARGTRLLEVGCSRGYKLEAARRAGWTVQGIELSASSYRFARDRLGLPVHFGTLDSYVSDGGFDAVIAWHVLEHVRSPSLFLSSIGDLLDRGGHLLLQVPSYTQYRTMPDWGACAENFSRVHYWYFTGDALRALLVRHGFDPVFEFDDPRFKHLTFVARRVAQGAPALALTPIIGPPSATPTVPQERPRTPTGD